VRGISSVGSKFFETGFRELTGHKPFEWQSRFFLELIADRWPEHCDIPTGLGKTSVIAIWMLAKAWILKQGKDFFPRRLFFIVDRRVVVDQATAEAEKLREKLLEVNAPPILREVRELFGASCLSVSEEPFAISTLRGQRRDNGDWFRDPSRTAVIVGTVDMIGSRLLFSGYGLGKYPASLQAGLLGQDTLVVLDEAHLCASFETLLFQARDFVRKHPVLRPFELVSLTATGRNASNSIFSINPVNETAEAAKRLAAKKTLSLIPVTSTGTKKSDWDNALLDQAVEEVLALAASNRSIVVYFDTVKLVLGLETRLKARGIDPVVLTGEMRGYERDAFLNSGTLSPFLKGRTYGTKTAILLATAAGEVGIDLDADDIVCDAVSLERTIQRIGRCNRFGNGAASIRVIVVDEFLDEPARETLSALQLLPKVGTGYDASPSAVSNLLRNKANFPKAFSSVPLTLELDDFVLDDWALTSVARTVKNSATGAYEPDYARPLVDRWLRGLEKEPEYHVSLVWRSDLESYGSDEDFLAMARALPLAPREIASVADFRVREILQAILREHGDEKIVQRSPDDTWSLKTVKQLLGEDIRNSTLYLPAKLGGLNKKGLPDPSRVRDGVADVVERENFLRFHLTEIKDTYFARELNDVGQLVGPVISFAVANWKASFRRQVLDPQTGLLGGFVPKFFRLLELDETTGDCISEKGIVYLAVKNLREDSYEGVRDMLLSDHLDTADRIARELVTVLGLPPNLAEAIVTAAANHDLGKDRPWWQKYVLGNTDYPKRKLAKIADNSAAKVSLNDYYRHEFGSLLDLDPKLSGNPLRGLILYLVAAHHGNARPFFEERQYLKHIKERPESKHRVMAMDREVTRLYLELQHLYGWWGLAYLEALVKCVDINAS
jgi:CRISPR-associated endonuclease/helicase Cas3